MMGANSVDWKPEARNQKSERMTKIQNPKIAPTGLFLWVSGFGHSFWFRVSDFGF
jgi:hypothetical protein